MQCKQHFISLYRIVVNKRINNNNNRNKKNMCIKLASLVWSNDADEV